MPASVLFIGFDPEKMDLADAPPGTAQRIQEGIDASMAALGEAGYEAEFLPLDESDAGARDAVRDRLGTGEFDCVVVGAGVRLLPKHTALFEAIVNDCVELAPHARLAFNATPADAADAVRRQLRV